MDLANSRRASVFIPRIYVEGSIAFIVVAYVACESQGSQQQVAYPVNKQEAPDFLREKKHAEVYGLKSGGRLGQSTVVGPGKYVQLTGLHTKTDE